MNPKLTLGQLLSRLSKMKSSIPAYLIGSLVDRGWSDNDWDLMVEPFTRTKDILFASLPSEYQEACHVSLASHLQRAQPLLPLGGHLLWDYADKEPFQPDPILHHSVLFTINATLSRFSDPLFILDAGCGIGHALTTFEALGHHAIGLSSSIEDVNALRNLGFEVYLMDMNCLDFPDNSFDIYWSHHSLEHSVAPCLALAEARRVLRPGGQAIISVPEGPSHTSHHYTFYHKGLTDLLHLSGFQPSSVSVRPIKIATLRNLLAIAKKEPQ